MALNGAIELDEAGLGVRALRGVALGDRAARFDVVLDGGRIASIEPVAGGAPAQYLALPAFANLHAHANRAFAAPSQRPRSLADAVAAAKVERASASAQDVRARARRLFERSIAHGVGTIRTHTDVDAGMGMRAIEGVLAAANDLARAIDVEIVAFASASADPARPANRDLLREAVHAGAALVGAVPAMYDDPLTSIDAVLELAAQCGVAADFHLDEHLDASTSLVECVADRVLAHRLHGRVTVSHGCALAAMSDENASRILEKMARVDMTLIVLPELNLYLQDRDGPWPRRRGLAPMQQALRAGVSVRLGTDNVRDWFFPFGDGDLLETGYVAALAAQIDVPTSLLSALCAGRSGLRAGDAANLVLIAAESFDDALARRPAGRVLLRAGRVVQPR